MKTKNCIYPPEISEITGKSLSHSRRLLVKIRVQYGLADGIPVPISKFLEYTGYSMEDIEGYLKSSY